MEAGIKRLLIVIGLLSVMGVWGEQRGSSAAQVASARHGRAAFLAHNSPRTFMTIVLNKLNSGHRAALSAYEQVIESELRRGATFYNVNVSDADGNSALMLASKKGNDHLVRLLVSAGSNVNKFDNQGNNALLLAVKNGHVATAELLIDLAHAPVNYWKGDGESPELVARQKGLIKLARKIKAAGAGLTIFRESARDRFMNAAKEGHEQEIRNYLKKGIDIDMQDAIGKTALMLAAFGGHTAVVQVLLDAGAQVNLQDNNGDTALALASKRGRGGVVQVLLRAHDININTPDEHGDTPLMSAVRNKRTEVVRELLDRGAGLHFKNNKSETVLDFDGNTTIKALIEKKIKKSAMV